MNKKIGVLIPCLNEALTIGKVVHDFRDQLPEAEIHVFDNASTDGSRQIAEEAGAIVHTEYRRGKGRVVQTMFQTLDADIYVMVDGDDTYPAEIVHDLIEDVANDSADMVVGSRFLDTHSTFRRLNRVGNQFFLKVINFLFGSQLTDVLSGYRAMSRRFVKGMPLSGTGFEVEIEMTIKALERSFRLHEIPCRLRDRPEGSHSKLRKFHDGLAILRTIFRLMREYRPQQVFGGIGLLALLGSLLPGGLALEEFLTTGSAAPGLLVSGGGLALAGLGATMLGTLMHGVQQRFQELDYLVRLRLPTPENSPQRRRKPPATPVSTLCSASE